MITPGINPEDEAFGFTYSWITNLASKVNKLVIITPRPYNDVPENVKVIEVRGNKLVKFFNLQKAIYLALKHENIDVVFTHMYLEFPIAAWPYAKLFRKRIATWYEHSSITFRLRFVNLLVDKIFSASKQGFRLNSNKHVILGHGIDTSFFKSSIKKQYKNILSVSRISRSKNLHTIIKAVSQLDNLELTIVGSPAGEPGMQYLEELKQLTKELAIQDRIVFAGGVNHKDIINYYNKASIFINTSLTGSIDKAGLEAMFSGLLLLTTNKAFSDILGNYKDLLLADESNLATKLANLLKLPAKKQKEISSYLIQQVTDNHSVDNLVSRMIIEFQTLINKDEK